MISGNRMNRAERILASRRTLLAGLPPLPRQKQAEEGGCGVVGFACSIPVGGRHIFAPSVQMHNRGNGKGGGIAAVGLVPEDLGVSQEVLDEDYLLHIALLDPTARAEVENEFLRPYLEIHHLEMIPTVEDYREVPGLELEPPQVLRCFARVQEQVLDHFIADHGLQGLTRRQAEDEFIYRNSFRLNQALYASLGEKRAFVLSHGRNLMILKIVGYAEQVAQFYRLDHCKAHIWIAHQRYPTRGRVWHPGGAHPFIGLHEALVHNGDFANYYAVCEYLKQRNVYPQFLTDTEVSVLLFDLWNRVYGYPLEYIIEALAPTTELDFDRLPADKQRLYRQIRATHIHGSPDGPWFFIIARNDPERRVFQLLGITDTAMLRPQVFALSEGDVQVGLIASEKQAIDATLHSLAAEDARFQPIADRYWNARGGSHTDGGAFSFTLSRNGTGTVLSCADKFGRPVMVAPGRVLSNLNRPPVPPPGGPDLLAQLRTYLASEEVKTAFEGLREGLAAWTFEELRWMLQELIKPFLVPPSGGPEWESVIQLLTLLNDRRYATGEKKRSSVLRLVREALEAVFSACPGLSEEAASAVRYVDWATRHTLRPPAAGEQGLVLNAADFPPEGNDGVARFLCDAYTLGWKRFLAYGFRGQRFCGCGLGPATEGVRIDVYGSSGDYLASGADGLEIHVHDNGQDQLAQIMKRGKLVVYGDVGQTFMYGAKGGEVFVLGNAAGRPLINAAGRPRVVINGTCLDYLAESFMAGEPLNGGGFVILNGIEFDDQGRLRDQPTPYPGSNLFSLASGGAIYLRDPYRKVIPEQLNGGQLTELTAADWQLILPYLEENERLFGISVENDLLVCDGVRKSPPEIYRKVQAVKLAVLAQAGEGD